MIGIQGLTVEELGVEYAAKIVEQQAHRAGGLLRHHTVAQGSQLCGARQWNVGNPPAREAHKVLDERGRQNRAAVPAGLGRVRCRTAEERFPAADRRPIDAPGHRRRLRFAAAYRTRRVVGVEIWDRYEVPSTPESST